MSPEQCEGRDKISAKADVYSLGVMFYELLAGEPPFRADSSATLMRKHMVMEPPPIVGKAQDVPAGVVQVLHRMLAKEPDARPSMQELAAQLEHPDEVTAGSKTPGQRSLVLAASALVLLSAVGVLVFGRSRRAQPVAQPKPPVSAKLEAAVTTPTPPEAGSTASKTGTPESAKEPASSTTSTPAVASPPSNTATNATAKKKRDKNTGRTIAGKTAATNAGDAESQKPVPEPPKAVEAKAETPKEKSDPPAETPTPKKEGYRPFR